MKPLRIRLHSRIEKIDLNFYASLYFLIFENKNTSLCIKRISWSNLWYFSSLYYYRLNSLSVAWTTVSKVLKYQMSADSKNTPSRFSVSTFSLEYSQIYIIVLHNSFLLRGTVGCIAVWRDKENGCFPFHLFTHGRTNCLSCSFLWIKWYNLSISCNPLSYAVGIIFP